MDQIESITNEKNGKPPLGSGNGNGTGNGSNIPLPKRIGIIYSEVKREYFPTESQYITEKDARADAEAVAEYIRKMGIEPILYPGDSTLTDRLKEDNPEMVFNLVDSVKGSEYLSSVIPGIMEMLGIPYTGADILGLSLCYSKFLTQKILFQNGVPVPNFQLFITPNDLMDLTIRFPVISKLNEVHGGVEMTKDAVSENEKQLRDRLKYLIATYQQPVMVEEFIVGKEVSAYILEGLNTKIYMSEKLFYNYNLEETPYVFSNFDYQWAEAPESEWEKTYAKYEDNNLKDLVRKAFDAVKMSDYGKFDIRIDGSGRYYFIDSNPNNAFGPKETHNPMSYTLEMYGVTFNETLRRLIVNTMKGSFTDTKD